MNGSAAFDASPIRADACGFSSCFGERVRTTFARSLNGHFRTGRRSLNARRRRDFRVRRGFGCTPRIAGNSGELATCNTVSRASAVAGRRKLPLRRRERQPDGSTAGGHPHFFGNPSVLQSAPRPAIPALPDARSCKPSLRTIGAGTRQTSRAPRLCEIAHQVCVEAGSGALSAGIISSQAKNGDEHGVPTKKNYDGKIRLPVPQASR
jgi:hypothetical protein